MTGEVVLVTGSEYTGGLAALRGLRAAGFRPWAVVSEPDSFGSRSRAASGVVRICDPRVDPERSVHDLAEAVVRTGARVVLPGTEASLLAMSKHADAFPPGVSIGVPDLPTVLTATDKIALPDLAAAAGLQVPPTALVDARTGAGMADVRYPAMVKPLRSELRTADGLQRFEVRRVGTADELAAALAGMPGSRGLVQPHLTGPIRTVNGVAWEGDAVVTVHKLARRTWPVEAGMVCHATTTAVQPALDSAVRTLLRNLRWSGMFNLQFIETPDGGQHLIDLNPRIYHSLALAIRAGANLPAIWTELLLGRAVRPTGYRVGVHFRAEQDYVHLSQDLVHHPRGAHTQLCALLPARRTVPAVVSIRDPLPALVVLRRIGCRIASGIGPAGRPLRTLLSRARPRR